MKMFLTRLGEGSRMMVNGDPTQTDLPPGQNSGLGEAVELLSGLERRRPCPFRRRRRRAPRSRAADRRGLRERGDAPPRSSEAAAMSPRRSSNSSIEPRWRRALPGAQARARRRSAAAIAESGVKLARGAEMSVHLIDDAGDPRLQRAMARQGCADQRAVVSRRRRRRNRRAMLGDIFIAFETCEREAAAEGKPLRRSLSASRRRTASCI